MKLNLTKKQANALSKGKNINLKHADIGVGHFDANPDFERAIEKAYRNGKGIRLNGAGIMGQGIFGRKFDKGLKKVGIKKRVFKAALSLKPRINSAMEDGVQSLIKASSTHPELAPLIPVAIYGKNMASNYMEKPSSYQSNKGARVLARKSARDSMKEFSSYNESQGMASAPPMSGGKLDPFKKRNTFGSFNAVNGQSRSFAPEDSMAQSIRQKIDTARKTQAFVKPKPGQYHTLPYPTMEGSGIKGGRVNPYLPTNLLSKSGGSIAPTHKPKKVYTDSNLNTRHDQMGIDAESKFVARPYGRTFQR